MERQKLIKELLNKGNKEVIPSNTNISEEFQTRIEKAIDMKVSGTYIVKGSQYNVGIEFNGGKVIKYEQLEGNNIPSDMIIDYVRFKKIIDFYKKNDNPILDNIKKLIKKLQDEKWLSSGNRYHYILMVGFVDITLIRDNKDEYTLLKIEGSSLNKELTKLIINYIKYRKMLNK